MALPHAMGVSPGAKVDELKARGLFVELGAARLPEAAPEDLKPLARTAHAPFGFPAGWARRGRLNIAATDGAWRKESMLCLERYLTSAAKVPSIKLVNMHAAPRLWKEQGESGAPQPVGEYAILIESLRALAAFAKNLGLTITVENNRAYWDAVPQDKRFLEVPRSSVREYFGTTSAEWIQIWRDVDRDNLFLCLDTSHATTAVHRYDDKDERRAALFAYIAEPRALKHIHWNDNDPWDVAGREDRHLNVGTSGLGDEFNDGIRRLAGVTHLLEHFQSLPDLDGELRYIADL